jgi:hypothetical protein
MATAEKVQGEIQNVIGEDPTIRDAHRIIVTVEKQSIFKGGKEVVVLKGHVHTEQDKSKARELAHLHAGGRAVVDSLSISG